MANLNANNPRGGPAAAGAERHLIEVVAQGCRQSRNVSKRCAGWGPSLQAGHRREIAGRQTRRAGGTRRGPDVGTSRPHPNPPESARSRAQPSRPRKLDGINPSSPASQPGCARGRAHSGLCRNVSKRHAGWGPGREAGTGGGDRRTANPKGLGGRGSGRKWGRARPHPDLVGGLVPGPAGFQAYGFRGSAGAPACQFARRGLGWGHV